MWQSWQNKILLEAAKHGYKSETAEFYEQELDEQVKTVQGVKFAPFKAGRLTGWNVYHPGGGLVGFIEKGTNTKSGSTPSKLRVAGSGPDNFDKLVLNYWHNNSGFIPQGKNPSVTDLIGTPAKMFDNIAHWIVNNSTKWQYK